MAENMASDGGAMEHEVSTIRKMHGFIPKEQGKNTELRESMGLEPVSLRAIKVVLR